MRIRLSIHIYHNLVFLDCPAGLESDLDASARESDKRILAQWYYGNQGVDILKIIEVQKALRQSKVSSGQYATFWSYSGRALNKF